MMKKVLVIGNCMAQALHESRELFPYDVEFFYPLINEKIALNIDKNLVLTSNSRDYNWESANIELFKFDMFIVSAVAWWQPTNLRFRGSSQRDHPLRYIALDTWDISNVPHNIDRTDEENFTNHVGFALENTSVVRLVRSLSRLTNIPVIMQPVPGQNRVLATDPEWVINKWYGMGQGAKVWTQYHKSQYTYLSKLASASNITLLDDLSEDGFRDPKYSADWDPMWHVNKDFGALVINQILSL